jgi:hypothetical protein
MVYFVEEISVWGRGEAYTGFWWGNLRERDHWGNPGVDGRIIIIFINCKWVDTRWQWLFYVYTECDIDYY